MTMLTMTTGTVFMMWLGEQITERGIGNGMSLIIFAGIVVGLPQRHERHVGSAAHGQWGRSVLFLLVMMVCVIARSCCRARQRRITVQYAKRVVGRRMYGGSSTIFRSR